MMKTKSAPVYALLIALFLSFIFSTDTSAKVAPDHTKLILEAIGKPMKHKKVKKMLKALGENFERNEISDTYYEYSYKSRGIELRIVDDTFAYATLYGPNYGDYSKYNGVLPYNLNFTDSPERVRQKLGKPDITEDGESYLGLIYNAGKNMQLDFGKEDGEVTKMHYVFLRKEAYVPVEY